MKIGAIIAEYNPFHNGHAYQMQDFRDSQSLDYVIVVMSGNFVQRGEPAICDKRQRAMWALQAGADMVLELPVYYAASNAMAFARGAVGTLANIADVLGFGCETDNKEVLFKAASIDTGKLCDTQSGKSHPRAVYEAILSKYDKDIADVFANPNATLAMEYIRAINSICPHMQVHITKRRGTGHNEKNISGNFASASVLREKIFDGQNIENFVPSFVNTSDIMYPNTLDKFILYKLRSIPPCDFEQIADVAEGLHNLIQNTAFKCTCYSELLRTVKTKRYTLARLKRICIAATLGITQQMIYTPPQYIHVLGVRKTSKKVLFRHLSEKAQIPVIIKGGDYKLYTGISYPLLKTDTNATDIYSLYTDTLPRNDFTKKILIL